MNCYTVLIKSFYRKIFSQIAILKKRYAVLQTYNNSKDIGLQYDCVLDIFHTSSNKNKKGHTGFQ